MGLFVGQKQARKWFEFLSSGYNLVNPIVYSWKMREELLREIEEGRVLDVGVGTGYTSGHLKGAVGIDITWRMLRQAREGYNGWLVLSDAAASPFKAGVFSTIISAGSLYYFPDPDKALREFNSLLRDDGVLLTITPSTSLLKPFFHIFSREDLTRLFEDAGFHVQMLKPLRWYALLCKGRKIQQR
jgi:demethylmenaquinone methyltransferase/2-methoxy-6-polyprenyl-1,4-benzoquinol methylase